MRKRFEQQRELDAELIPDVKIDPTSRHELPKLLTGLQYIFITPELNEAVFEILEQKILKKRKDTGRPGLSLWEILVLGTMRLNLDTDYDALQDLANNHRVVQGILGVHKLGIFGTNKYYALQTLKDNIALLDDQTLKEVSEVVVKAGHQLKKKEESEEIELKLKTDSYAVESNIHFPTDISLVWDCARKCLDTLKRIKERGFVVKGMRKQSYWYKEIKKCYRSSSNIHQRKGKDYKRRLKKSTGKYLDRCSALDQRLEGVKKSLEGECDIILIALLEVLNYYHLMLKKHIDLVERRIIKGEQIPHSEKIFSIFEPHVEWIQKGKQNNKVELGHNVCVTTDQYHFIVDHKVMIGEVDKAQVIPLALRLRDQFEQGYVLKSISFDRGFYSFLALKAISKYFEKVVMPKKGKKTTHEEEQEKERSFVVLSNKHSAVESNINELEHSGVNRVPDKGLDRFEKYVALGVLAYNIKRLGKLVIEQKLLPTLKQANEERRAA